MKKWLSMLLFTGIGFGVGFFAGERFGKKHGNEPECGETPRPIDAADHVRRISVDDVKDHSDKILKENGYIPTEEDQQAADEYFRQFEHPEEDGGEDYIQTGKAVTSKHTDEQYITLSDVDGWENEYEFSKVELYFYEEDEVVCDEDEKRIDDPEDLIGHEALHSFGENPVNPYDEVYVRNTFTETLYKITRIHNAYGRVVLGLDDDAPMDDPFLNDGEEI